MLHHEAHESAANGPPVTGGLIRNGGAEVVKANDAKLREQNQNKRSFL